MSETIDIFVPLDDADASLGPRLERALGWGAGTVGRWRIIRRSLDARKGRALGYRLRVEAVRTGEEWAAPVPIR
ncbi:MAG TPA: hypothetical protein VFH73_22570, partial [Polyangia bacterium]|nr:hypothetical protein [Polyangia bacterium]